MSENKGPWKDSDHPVLAILSLAGVLFLWGCAVAVFLGAGYVCLKICGPVLLFLGAFLLDLIVGGPPR